MPVIAMTCIEKQAHERTDQLFIYLFGAPEHERRTIVANLTNVYAPGDVAAIATVGTQLPEAEIVPRKVFGVESFGMALGPVEALPGTDVTEQFGADAPLQRFKLTFEVEGVGHYPERIEKDLRKALAKGEGSLLGAVSLGPAPEEA